MSTNPTLQALVAEGKISQAAADAMAARYAFIQPASPATKDETLDSIFDGESMVPNVAPISDPLPLVPEDLKSYPNWVTWESQEKKGPRISGTILNALSNEPATWVDYQTAVDNIAKGLGFKNLGFVTNGKQSGHLTGLDLDGCRNPATGKIAEWAQRIITFCSSYCEITPSGTGLRVWVTAELPANHTKKFYLALTSGFGSKVQIEVFSDGLYFTVTGDRLEGSTSEVRDLSAAKVVELFNLFDDLRKQYPVVDDARQDDVKKSPRTRAIHNPDGTITFVAVPPDDGFKKLFDVTGWKPFADRLARMADSRFHAPDLKPGELMYCPMPGHGTRGVDVRYNSRSFGVIDGADQIVHCFGCGWSGDMVKACRVFDGGEEGGKIEYATMYDVARKICEENDLIFEDYFESQTADNEAGDISDYSSPFEHTLTAEQYEAELDAEFPVIPLAEQAGPWWDDSVFYGPAGELIKKASQYNEAHPAGMLLDFLVAFGNMIGHGPYFNINSTRHYTNEYLARVGDSSYSRKGGGRDAIDEPLKIIDKNWFQARVVSGFGSSEAIVHNIRDTRVQKVFNKKKNRYEDLVSPGIDDKRLCIREPELASIFVLAGKAESRADIVLREGWDSKPLRNIVKGATEGINNSAFCMEPHISISGDTTSHELISKMPEGADENGFGNRFLYCYVYRVKLCPNGGPDLDWSEEIPYFYEALQFAKAQKYVALSPAAKKVWIRMYTEMENNHLPGQAGKMTSRGAPHIRRLALIYAMIDKSPIVETRHLHAAKKLWDYCEESARYIFNKYTREHRRILLFVEKKSDTTLTEIREELFHRNKRAGWIKSQVKELSKGGFVTLTGEKVKFLKTV